MQFLLGLIIGLLIGGVVGVMTISLVVASRDETPVLSSSDIQMSMTQNNAKVSDQRQ